VYSRPFAVKNLAKESDNKSELIFYQTEDGQTRVEGEE
jgi:hypothetical protein